MKSLVATCLLLVGLVSAIQVVVFELRPSGSASAGWQKNIEHVKTKLEALGLRRGESLVVLPEYGIVNDIYLDPFTINTAQKIRAACNWFRTVVIKATVRSGNALCVRLECTETPAEGPAGAVLNLARQRETFIAANLLTKHQDALYNAEFLFNRDGRQAVYLKQKPIPAEASNTGFRIRSGVVPGNWTAPANWGNAKIGFLICFDIIFPSAQKQAREENIKAFIFSTEWESRQELFSLAVQQAFSRMTRTWLFASNVNNALRASGHVLTGSSIISAGAVLQHHVGPLPGDRGENAFSRELTQEVDFTAPHATPFNDEGPLLRGEGPARATSGGSVTDMQFLLPGQRILPEYTVRAGDLQCKFLLTATGPEVPSAATVAYVLRAQNGIYAGRRIRSCTMLAIPKEFAASAHFRRWSKYDLDIPFRFSSAAIESNVHGSNVATLPLVLLMNADTVPKPVQPSQSTFRLAGGAESSRLTVTPAAHEPLAILSVYGVVSNDQTSELRLNDAMQEELPTVGDSVVYRVSSEGTDFGTCPVDPVPPVFASVKERLLRRSPKSLAP